MTPTLLIAAHGTRSASGTATTRALAAAVAAARPSVPVRLCFLDVVPPSLADALDGLSGEVVVVPLLLAAGYHVATDIPAIVAGRSGVRVAGHLGPDPLVMAALADRLRQARPAGSAMPASTALAAVASSRSAARSEVTDAVDGLARELGREVTLLPLGTDSSATLAALPAPVEVAVYLISEGTFLDELRLAAANLATVAAPLGVHPLLVELVLARYDRAAGAR